MITKIGLNQKRGNSHIQVMYPGEVLQNGDTGLGTLGRIDQANIHSGTTIKMHPHINDDILSYFRVGNVKHTDSANFTEHIGRDKLMLMKAGKVFYHEEEILEQLEGLQIFIRPQKKDTSSEVIFYELPETDSLNKWRSIASPTFETPLKFSSQTWIYDVTMNENGLFQLPIFPKENLTALLYTFQGNLLVNENIELAKGECIIIKNEKINFKTEKGAELVLFLTDENSEYFDGGAFSGNQIRN
jgi:quercetin 2,3-dioxygenase